MSPEDVRTWDRVRIGSGRAIHRVLAAPGHRGFVATISEASGRTQLVAVDRLRLVERDTGKQHE